MLDLVIITGASRGIGGNIASQCNENVARNLITISSSGKHKHIDWETNNLISLKLNLSDHKNVCEAVQAAVSDMNVKSLGVILCGAQLGEPGGLFASELEDWDKTYQCNVLGNLAVVKACSQIITAGAKTRIAFFAGGGGAYGYPEFSGYALSKVATVRAVENVGMEFAKMGVDASIVAVAPGAVATDMLAKVLANGGSVKTKTDIKEPTNFVWNFLEDKFDAKNLNGRFVHVRDILSSVNWETNADLFKLRRVQ
jgi:NAD(P)-dependent dehydrogenase (short-subunit alcohol dehydrogenase family)